MSQKNVYLTLNKHTLSNWVIASEEEVERTKNVLVDFVSKLTKVEKKEAKIYRVSVHASTSPTQYSILMISPLKKLFTLCLDKDLKVLMASHIMSRDFSSAGEKDMRKKLPLKLNQEYQLDYGEKLFALLDNDGVKTNLQWVHKLPKEISGFFELGDGWIDVEIHEHERVADGKLTDLTQSDFILYNPPIELGGSIWHRVVNIICDGYGYWDVKYYLVNCAEKTCIDLNGFDHYYCLGGRFDAIWIENNQLLGVFCSDESKAKIQENVQLYPSEPNNLLKEALYKKLFPMTLGMDGLNTLAANLDENFSVTSMERSIK